jgi:hypothetical protein
MPDCDSHSSSIGSEALAFGFRVLNYDEWFIEMPCQPLVSWQKARPQPFGISRESTRNALSFLACFYGCKLTSSNR